MNNVSKENPFHYNIPSSNDRKNKDLTTIIKKNNFVDDYSDDMLPQILAEKNLSNLNATGRINISKSNDRIPNPTNLRINKADITSMLI
jgi:hypothetical protein